MLLTVDGVDEAEERPRYALITSLNEQFNNYVNNYTPAQSGHKRHRQPVSVSIDPCGAGSANETAAIARLPAEIGAPL